MKKYLDADWWKNVIVILTIGATVLVAIVAVLQADAGIRANGANRNSQYYAIRVSGELQRAGLQGNYDMAIFQETIQARYTSTVLQLTALKAEQNGDSAGAADALLRAQTEQARADTAQASSILYTDKRYAPSSAEGLPNADQYLADLHEPALKMLKQQNDSVDAYNIWNARSDTYTAILTVMAIALFLFGLAQAVTPRLRLLFALFGTIGTLAAALWTLLTVVT